ncbi:MAG: M23 family metallopeptidase [Saprospiraceae bacterium]
MKTIYYLLLLCAVNCCACEKTPDGPTHVSTPPKGPSVEEQCRKRQFDYTQQEGCDGQVYPNPVSSLYFLPFDIGASFSTGLTNCSSSYHAAGQPDQYAFDFDLPEEAPFTAARPGVVHSVEESEPSTGGGPGNGVVIDHGDQTYGIYLHAPKNGILVEVGDSVSRGDILGFVGRSGLAGYPHLHFIVVRGSPVYPYKGIPVSFKNVYPADVILASHTRYTACDP